MEYSQIILTIEEKIAKIILNRPEAYNAFSDTMKSELSKALDEIRDNPVVRVVVISGAGKAFCSGGDLKNMAQSLNQTSLDKRDNLRNGMAVILKKLSALEQPVIASIDGPAIGAGCGLAMACDFRVASAKAIFGVPFVKRGLIPDWGCTFYLPRLIGTGKALEMVLTGEIIDAQTALEIGLVNNVVAPGQLEETVNQLCAEISQNAPVAMAAARDAVYYGSTHSLYDSLENEIYVQSMCQQTEDYKEGVVSFAEKRSPVFKRK